MNDLDSLLMPPPPPRLSKRQKVVDVAPSVSSSLAASATMGTAAAESIKSGQSTTPHDSIFLRQQNCTAVDPFNNNSGRGGGRSRKGRSVSPDDIDAKIIVTCVDNGSGEREGGGGKDDDIKSKSDAFVFGEGVKKLEGTFDLASDSSNNTTTTTTTTTTTCATHNHHHHEFSNDDNNLSTSQNYDPSAAVVSTVATINKSDEGKEEEPLGKIVDKTQSSQHHGYDIPPITTSFRDIIGHGQAKLRLDEALLPLALPPDLADSVLSGIRAAPASILLHGPPGCGKTKLAKAVAGEAQASFLSVGPSDILSKFVGESEQSIRGLFREARARAKKMESKCTVVFFDEIDALGRSRVDEGSSGESQSGGDHSSRRVLAELLIQMTALSNAANGEEDSESDEEEEDYDGYCDDSFTCQSTLSTAGSDGFGRRTTQARNTGDDGMNNKVQVVKPRIIVVAATNRPEDCDPALLRRFAVRVLVGLPTRKDRKKIIKRLLLDVDHTLTSAQLDELAVATEGWSGSDLESMTREAVMAPVRECLRAAAILKKKAGRAMQHISAVSSKADDSQKEDEDVHSSTRESLLNSFRSLRPVSSKDFGDGIAFFLGEQQDNMSFSDLSRHAHYDSSSSSSEDEEDSADE